MAVNATISIRSNRFPALATTFIRGVDDALDLATATCLEVANPMTPVDTGALVSNKTIDRGEYSREITWNQEYAAFQNNGTVHIAPKQFADRGAEAAEPALLQSLRGLA